MSAVVKKHLMNLYARLEKAEATIAEQAKDLAKAKTETERKLSETALKLKQGHSEIESRLKKVDAKMGKMLDEKASELSQQVAEIESKLRKDLRDGVDNLRGIIAKDEDDLSEFKNKVTSDVNQLKKDMLPAAEFREFAKKFAEDLDLGEIGEPGVPEEMPSLPEELPSLPEELPGELPQIEGTNKPSSKSSKKKA